MQVLCRKYDSKNHPHALNYKFSISSIMSVRGYTRRGDIQYTIFITLNEKLVQSVVNLKELSYIFKISAYFKNSYFYNKIMNILLHNFPLYIIKKHKILEFKIDNYIYFFYAKIMLFKDLHLIIDKYIILNK